MFYGVSLKENYQNSNTLRRLPVPQKVLVRQRGIPREKKEILPVCPAKLVRQAVFNVSPVWFKQHAHVFE